MNKWNFNKEVDHPKVKVPTVKSNEKSIIEYFYEVDKLHKKIGVPLCKQETIKLSYQKDIKKNQKKRSKR